MTHLESIKCHVMTINGVFKNKNEILADKGVPEFLRDNKNILRAIFVILFPK